MNLLLQLSQIKVGRACPALVYAGQSCRAKSPGLVTAASVTPKAVLTEEADEDLFFGSTTGCSARETIPGRSRNGFLTVSMHTSAAKLPPQLIGDQQDS